MKRSHLDSRRVRVVLPASRPPLPKNTNELLSQAFALGKKQAAHFLRSRDVRQDLSETELDGLRSRDEEHQGLRHLCRAMFFSGLHTQIENLSRKEEIVSQPALKNIYYTGATAHKELTLAQIHLTQADNARLFHLSVPGLLGEWWTRQCAGAIAVARLAHFLLSEGLLVYLPTETEDVNWKIDLIATVPGESRSICFQVRSDCQIEWPRHKVWRAPPSERDSDVACRFFEGVRRFQKHTHGVYVPVELTLSSQHYADGAIVTKGHTWDALHHILVEATKDGARTTAFASSTLT